MCGLGNCLRVWWLLVVVGLTFPACANTPRAVEIDRSSVAMDDQALDKQLAFFQWASNIPTNSSAPINRSTTRPANKPDIAKIDKLVSDIDLRPMNAKTTGVQFPSCQGSYLTWFTAKDAKVKVFWSVGRSTDVLLTDFYFHNNKLIMTYLRKMDYPKNPDGTPIHDMNRLKLSAEGWQYFKNGELIYAIAEPAVADLIARKTEECNEIPLSVFMMKNWGKEDLDFDAVLSRKK